MRAPVAALPVDCHLLAANCVLEGIEARAATHRLAECLAEMAQARVANFQRSFRNVVFAGSQQFRRALHPQLPQILRDRHPGFLGEYSTQVKRAAAGFAPDGFESGWVDEIPLQNGYYPRRALPGQPFLPIAKQLVLSAPFEEKLCHEL
jgi:hypothetical protein